MAVGPYAHDHQINEHRLDNLLKSYNSIIGSTTGPGGAWGAVALNNVNATLFSDTIRVPYQSDNTAAQNQSLNSGVSLFFESGNTGVSTIDFTTNGASAVIVLQASNSMNFNDLGSTGDNGDIIIGSNADQYIQVNQGNNTVVAGSAHDTIVGGVGHDFLLGGGLSSLVAGTGSETLIAGFSTTASDTLVGSSGDDVLKTKFGSNEIIAGSGHETIKSGFNGNTNDHISLLAGGTAQVTVGTASHDTVTYGGGGHDTITAQGAVDLEIKHGEQLVGLSATNGVTSLTFADGGSVSYTGNGHVTVHFN